MGGRDRRTGSRTQEHDPVRPRHRDAARQAAGRQAAGFRVPEVRRARRHVGERHFRLLQARRRDQGSEVESRGLHPVQPLLDVLPARGNSPGSADRRGEGRRARKLHYRSGKGPRQGRAEVQFPYAAFAVRLPRLRRLPDRVPGKGRADLGTVRGDEVRAAAVRRRRNERNLPQEGRNQRQERQECSVRKALLPVLRRLRRLRRDYLYQAAQPAVRRPHVCRQRSRLLVRHQRRRADPAVLPRLQGSRPGVGALAV